MDRTPTQLKTVGWQPGSTAPKDGRWILAICAHRDDPAVCRWDGKDWRAYSDSLDVDGQSGFAWCGLSGDIAIWAMIPGARSSDEAMRNAVKAAMWAQYNGRSMRDALYSGTDWNEEILEVAIKAAMAEFLK